ncbi:helix-turn-helix domain-containing protein [Streptomyces canus]
MALGPVSGLWGRLSGWQQDQVEAAAKAEVKRLAGMLEQPEVAARLLADRLTDRLEESGGEALVDRPFPWLIRRGLVQRQACADRRCDDGIRLDTGGECENCGNVIHIARDVRVSERSVERWRRAWREGGMDALATAGPPKLPRLSDGQFAELEKELALGPAVHGCLSTCSCAQDPGVLAAAAPRSCREAGTRG